VFSKRAFALPVKDKRGSTIAKAFEIIFTEAAPNMLHMLQTDRGTEFLNREVQNVFQKYNTHHYWSLNDTILAECVERYNRTLKTRMFRYLTHRNTNRWVDVLSSLIKGYNSSFHRTIGMAPDDDTHSNEREISQRMFLKKPKLVWKYQFGDKARISKFKHIFEKGYLPNWTQDIFIIFDRYPTYPVTYGLKDLGDEEIKGKFMNRKFS